jgi:hypothetical protein
MALLLFALVLGVWQVLGQSVPTSPTYYTSSTLTTLCLLPFCTQTTTTTTNVVTEITVQNVTTAIVISQPVVVCIAQANVTVTESTSTCTAACTPTVPPEKRYQLCRYHNGDLRALFNTVDFVGGLAACEAFDWHMADLTAHSFNEAAQVAANCLGQDRRIWIRTYEGDAQPCLVLNTGDSSKLLDPFLEIVPCNLTYPVLCQISGYHPPPSPNPQPHVNDDGLFGISDYGAWEKKK